MASRYNFTIKQNADFSRLIVWNDDAGTPVNLTGKTARLVAKVNYSDTAPVIDITSADNITLGTTNGHISIAFSALETAEFTQLEEQYERATCLHLRH